MKGLTRVLKGVLRVVLIVIGVLVVGGFAFYLWSLTMPAVQPVQFSSKPDPAQSYDDALVQFDSLVESYRASGTIDPNCLPYVLVHGQKTERSIILLHGFTACPFQYKELSSLFFDQGYNVYVPLLPRHGLADRTANVLADLTAEELAGVMDPAVDLAAGLGDQVTLTGLSLGGNVAVLGGQLRPDLHLAAPMSPAFGLRFVPNILTPALTRIILGLPDFYIWWDPINQAKFQAASGYPGYSSHALGQIFRMGLSLLELAKTERAAAPGLLMITNWGDPAINLGATDEVVREWQKHGGLVQTYRFPLLPWLPHDFISVDAPGAKTEITYPKLLELLTESGR